MSLLGNIWVKLGLKSDDFQRGLDNSHKRAERFGTAIGKIGAKMVLAWAAVGVALTRMFKASVENYQQQEAANRKLQNALKNTGSAIGTNYDELKRYASELQRVNGFADDATMNAMATLTTFRNVQGQVFKDTIKAAQDMAAFMGTDLNTAVQQLGKALEAPEIGLQALRRSGVVFTKETQEGIKKLVAEGKTYEAQLVILEEVHKRFGGAAATQAETAAGQWKRVGMAFSDLSEHIGRSSEASRGLAKGLADTLEYADRIISSESLTAWQKFWAIISNGSKKADEALAAEDAARAESERHIKQHTDIVMSGVKSVADAQAALAKQQAMYDEASAKGWDERAAEAKGAVDALNAYIATAETAAEKEKAEAAEQAKRYKEWLEQHTGILNELKDEIAEKEKLLRMAKDYSEIKRLKEEIELLKLKQQYAQNGTDYSRGNLFQMQGLTAPTDTLTAKNPLGIDTSALKHTEEEVDDFLKAFKAQEEKAEDISNGFATALQNGMLNALDELAEAIGSGDWDTGAMLKALISPLADMAISAGVIVSGLGEAIQAMKLSLTSLQGPIAIAAGAALIAAGVAAKAGLAAIAKNGGKGSATGGASNPYTYAGGYGVAAGAGYGGTVELAGTVTVKGQDIQIALDNYNKNKRR